MNQYEEVPKQNYYEEIIERLNQMIIYVEEKLLYGQTTDTRNQPATFIQPEMFDKQFSNPVSHQSLHGVR